MTHWEAHKLTLGGTVRAHHRRPRKPPAPAAQPPHLLQAAVVGPAAPTTKEKPSLPGSQLPGNPRACSSRTPTQCEEPGPPSRVHGWFLHAKRITCAGSG